MTARDYEASGDRYLANGDATMAFVQYEKALALDPDNRRIPTKQGLLFLDAGKPAEAAAAFEKVLAREPDQAAAREGLGRAYFEMKRYDEAESILLQAVAVDPALARHNYLGNIYDFSSATTRPPGSMPRPSASGRTMACCTTTWGSRFTWPGAMRTPSWPSSRPWGPGAQGAGLQQPGPGAGPHRTLRCGPGRLHERLGPGPGLQQPRLRLPGPG
jgi:hypothetical protein